MCAHGKIQTTFRKHLTKLALHPLQRVLLTIVSAPLEECRLSLPVLTSAITFSIISRVFILERIRARFLRDSRPWDKHVILTMEYVYACLFNIQLCLRPALNVKTVNGRFKQCQTKALFPLVV